MKCKDLFSLKRMSSAAVVISALRVITVNLTSSLDLAKCKMHLPGYHIHLNSLPYLF